MKMSEFIEEMLSDDRLNPNSKLSDSESDGYKLLDNTIGWWMDKVDDEDRFSQLFITTATGKYLDIHGSIKGIYRNDGEDDETFRERLINTQNFKLTKEGINSLGGEVYCFVDNINTQITSKNVVLSNEYIIDIDDTNILDNHVNNHVWHILSKNDIGSV